MPSKPHSFFVALGLILLVAGCDSKPQSKETTEVAAKVDSHEPIINQIVKTEALILDLSPYVSRIGESLSHSGTCTRESLNEFFVPSIQFAAVGESEFAQVENFPVNLWQPFMGDRKFIECKFGTLKGSFDERESTFSMKTKFEGKLSDPKGIVAVAAQQTITWTRINKLWTITHWRQHSFDASEPTTALFADVTMEIIADKSTVAAVSNASHQKRVGEVVQSGSVMEPLIKGLPGFNDWESLWQFPSVSIVDYDNDGWDDVFLVDRWENGMLLKNVNGKFVESTEESGLNIGPNTNCVLFADFDNDGDADAFAGRTIFDSQYYENTGGKFRLDESMTEELKLVRFVTGGSVADFNGDGLLDLYLSTYVATSGSAAKGWFETLLPESDIQRYAKVKEQHPFVDRGGPANILLVNENGKLKRCEITDVLKQWRNSFQSSWHDWDGDGDPDLFVGNDFAPDAFLRNDTPRGSSTPIFVDVTSQLIGPEIMGYSMGASWGDYDNDGDMDLYVSQMYSKAGKRILKQFSAADKRSVKSAQGSFLFRNEGDSFAEVAVDAHVAKVGWSFGGQFVDLDNNGWLDLYVPSGFYTAPESVRSDVDL